jgi:hypothetical protein
MASQVVKVKRETIEACMTCPLCNKLLKEATTISLCLHTCELSALSVFAVNCSCFCGNFDLGLCLCCIWCSGFFMLSVIAQFLKYLLELSVPDLHIMDFVLLTSSFCDVGICVFYNFKISYV